MKNEDYHEVRFIAESLIYVACYEVASHVYRKYTEPMKKSAWFKLEFGSSYAHSCYHFMLLYLYDLSQLVPEVVPVRKNEKIPLFLSCEKNRGIGSRNSENQRFS